ncbi:alanine--tRNA ligase [Stenomitos frigidus]|uniref:Alanine--tRNA ligase n=1 Tax=Stenomitos frigidus ULC18 TaxID=2107698 RepID=A0A2T1DW88_9CYAN|nr:alanine--tRNA ligase [Stenomitos frigidus]PSB24732.1 alanine--tRNA ligase [Stenomitos frigidus ULC18]
MATPFSGTQIRQTFLNFYAARGHQILPSASLVPEDPTVLLTIAGMLPFKPIFLGQRPAEFPRATTSQKCIRTNDIENVGRTARHHTFFEMLGNFSFGDYFKSQAIAWAWELSTKVYGLPPERLVVSVFEDDDEAFALWRDEIGIPAHRIQRMGEKDNFWVSGPTGPCGPCSEMYYDFHPEKGDEHIDLEDDTRFIEFYNLVFMQYNRDTAGNLTPLANKNIDTGLGLERMAQILQKVPNNYETDLIFPIIQSAAAIANLDYATVDETTKIALKVIGDHVRAVVHMIADGIVASNEGRGYVLRRLIRRVIRYGRLIGIDREFTPKVAEAAIALSESAYPDVRIMERTIKVALQREEIGFLKTLDRGEKLLADITEQVGAGGQISGTDAFTLYDTYGFPLELTEEIAAEKGLTIDTVGFETEMEQQRRRSQLAHTTIDLTAQGTLDHLANHIEQTEFLGYTQPATNAIVQVLMVNGKPKQLVEAGTAVQVVLDQTPFYAESGGQIGDRGYLSGDDVLVRIEDVQKESAFFVHYGRVERGTLHTGDSVTAQIDLACRRRAQAHHTATHLLQSALKKLVDDNISQAGSLVSFDRLRFDFHCPRPLTPDELQQVEDQVNTWIAEAHKAQTSILPIAEAKAKGAIAMFGEKYGSEVRVLDVAGVSMELCGGTHVSNTAEIGLFKIVSEAGVAAGIRRIEAIAGPAVLEYLNVRDAIVRDLSDRFKVKPEEISDRITTLQTELKTTQKQLETAKGQLALAKADNLLAQAEAVGEFHILIAQLDGVDPESLKTAAEQLQQKLANGAVVLGSVPEADKVSLVAAFSPAVIQKGLQAGKLVGAIAKLTGGGGGGRPNLAQAGGRDASKLPEALAEAKKQLQSGLS